MIHPAHLRAFHAVASEGGFTRGARALRVSQPTVSSQVKALEERYGVSLLERRGRQVTPTELGRRLLAVTRRLFSLEEEAEQLLGAARALRRGQLKVGADGPQHVMPLLAALERGYPGLEVSLSMGNADKVRRELLDYRIDVAVLALVAQDERLLAVPCWRSPLVLFVPRAHPWARRASVPLAEVAEQRMVLRETASVTRQIFADALAAADVRPRAVMQVESREAVREAVAAGLGAGVISAAEFGADPRLVAVPLQDVHLEMTEYAVCLRERRRLRTVQAFLEMVGQLVAAQGTAERQ